MRQRKTTQTWSSSASGRGATLRVLIESADPALAVSDFGAFTAAGIDVALCHGPDHTPAECPVVRGEACPLAAGADVVLFDLGPTRGEVFEARRRVHPATPVVLRGGAAKDGPGDCESIPPSASVQGQIGVLRRVALGARADGMR
jgi:hypothetical protein